MAGFDRKALVQVLIWHQSVNVNGRHSCSCGWSELGASHAEHVVGVFEEIQALVDG